MTNKSLPITDLTTDGVVTDSIVTFQDETGSILQTTPAFVDQDGNMTIPGNLTVEGDYVVDDIVATTVTADEFVGGTFTGSSYNKVAITAPATNATLTLAQGSTLATGGAFSTTLTATATTNVTLPTTGTLSTLAGTETLTNKTLTSATLVTPNIGVASGTSVTVTSVVTDTLEVDSLISGTATLAGTPGTITVSTAAIATGDKIFVSRNTPGGTLGNLSAPVASIVNATSFVINSDANETSTVNWFVLKTHV